MSKRAWLQAIKPEPGFPQTLNAPFTPGRRKSRIGNPLILLLIAALLPGAGAWAVFCPVCGQDRGDTFKFCPADGTDLGAIRSQVRGDRPRGQETPGPNAGNVPTQEPLPFIPTLPEE